MKIGIISDIHANIEALMAVFEYFNKYDIHRIVCLGDIVGYGPNPNEALELIASRTDTIVAGNHDHAAIGLTDITFFNEYAKKAIQWTRDKLLDENIEILRSFPFTNEIEDESVLLVHASPLEPDKWLYIFTISDSILQFSSFDEQIVFVGHSHQPLVFKMNKNSGVCDNIRSSFFQIEEKSRYIINVGSVGQPRDNNPMTSFGIFDTDERTVQIVRLEYDYFTTQRKIIKAGLPEILAQRLALGV